MSSHHRHRRFDRHRLHVRHSRNPRSGSSHGSLETRLRRAKHSGGRHLQALLPEHSARQYSKVAEVATASSICRPVLVARAWHKTSRKSQTSTQRTTVDGVPVHMRKDETVTTTSGKAKVQIKVTCSRQRFHLRTAWSFVLDQSHQSRPSIHEPNEIRIFSHKTNHANFDDDVDE